MASGCTSLSQAFCWGVSSGTETSGAPAPPLSSATTSSHKVRNADPGSSVNASSPWLEVVMHGSHAVTCYPHTYPQVWMRCGYPVEALQASSSATATPDKSSDL